MATRAAQDRLVGQSIPDRHMDETQNLELRATLARLKEDHRDLDAAIAALEAATVIDRLQIQRLKKRKLALKDQIIGIEDMLIPNIIA